MIFWVTLDVEEESDPYLLFDRNTVSIECCNICNVTYCYQMTRNQRFVKRNQKMCLRCILLRTFVNAHEAEICFKFEECNFISKSSHELGRHLMKYLLKCANKCPYYN